MAIKILMIISRNYMESYLNYKKIQQWKNMNEWTRFQTFLLIEMTTKTLLYVCVCI